jgi:hypothetical protein
MGVQPARAEVAMDQQHKDGMDIMVVQVLRLSPLWKR